MIYVYRCNYNDRKSRESSIVTLSRSNCTMAQCHKRSRNLPPPQHSEQVVIITSGSNMDNAVALRTHRRTSDREVA